MKDFRHSSLWRFCTVLCLLFGGIYWLSAKHSESSLDSLDAVQVQRTLEAAAQWQMAHPNESVGLRWWHMAPYYDGLIELSKVTGNPRYLTEVIARGEQTGWALGDRKYHADDHAVGHAWLDVFAMDPERNDRMEFVKKRLDEVIASPVRKQLRFGIDGYPGVTERWSWCDALYMAPPTLARLYTLTGDDKYLRFMDHEYRWTYDELWDADEKLFYRDARFLGKLTEEGKKVFWSRGNGWVYGGLPMILDALSETDSSRSFYETLFLEMSEAIKSAQQPDGLWRPNLADPMQVRTGESSGSGFFLYGIAWGIRNGLLSREDFEGVLLTGWKGLMTRIQPEGYIGYVQPVGFDPRDNIEPSSTHVYGAGSLMLAGSEILRLMGAASEKPISELYSQAQASIDEGSWIPAAGGYVVPRRFDDLGWENDKMAFRVYGPQLRDSTEDSGVDVWSKRVDEPVVYKWFMGSFDGSINYHEDTGEGYDGYKVGANRGCGGTGLFYKGRLYTANTYYRGSVMYSTSDHGKLLLEYHYDIDGTQIKELKTITLKKGDILCEARSEFRGSGKVLNEASFVIGLTPQSDDVLEIVNEEVGFAMWESFGGFELGMAVKLKDVDSKGIKYQTLKGSQDHFLMIPLGETRELAYQFGYTWTANAPKQTLENWAKTLGLL